jgi:hypothetical protein
MKKSSRSRRTLPADFNEKFNPISFLAPFPSRDCLRREAVAFPAYRQAKL